MPENNSDSIRTQVKVKAQSDTDERLARFQEMRRTQRRGTSRRKVKLEVLPGKKEIKKELFLAEAQDSNTSIFTSEGNLGIILALGITVAVINDFVDLVTWQKISLIGQTIDITSLVLLLFMAMFMSRIHFISVFIIFIVFLFEILPVVGVLPWWTIGVIAWYLVNRKKG